MKRIISFNLINETMTKDTTGQPKTIPTPSKDLIGQLHSVYQNEFYKAEQAGIRPQGVIEMSIFDYGGQNKLTIGSEEFTIYRTFEVGTDRIELYFGERVGNNG